MRRLLQRRRVIPRSVLNHIAIDVNVIVAGLALPGAPRRVVVRAGREDLVLLYDGRGRKVDVALNELEGRRFGESGAGDGCFGVHLVPSIWLWGVER